MKGVTTRSHLTNFYQYYSFVFSLEPLKVEQALGDPDWVMAMQGAKQLQEKPSVDFGGMTQYQCHWYQVGLPQQAR